MKESDVLNAVRLEATQQGVRLWRNNVGATYTRDGSFIRYGLCNESSAVNDVMKSGDLIGIRPMIIEKWMVGGLVGVFVSRECKASDWKPDNSKRTKAQIAWRDLILQLGGDAEIVSGTGSV
jgi:hypothetical protein